MIYRRDDGTRIDVPVVPGQAGAARPPRTRADKTVMGQAHLSRRGPIFPIAERGDVLSVLDTPPPVNGRYGGR